MHSTHFPLARWLPWLLSAVAAPLLGHCGGATEPSTETNPPGLAANTDGAAMGGGNSTTGTTDGFDLASASCDALESTLNATAAAASAAARTDCQSDSDCSSGVLQNAVTVCTELNRRCGAAAALRCTNLPLTLACTNGKCQGLRCDDLGGTVFTRVDDAWASASHSCTTTADCSLLGYELRCVASCGPIYRSVASGAVPQLAETAQAADATLCGEFERRDCPRPVPLPCGPAQYVRQAVCVAGQCDVDYVPPP